MDFVKGLLGKLFTAPLARHVATLVIGALLAILANHNIKVDPDTTAALTTGLAGLFIGIVTWALSDHSATVTGKQVNAIAKAADMPKGDVIALAAKAVSGDTTEDTTGNTVKTDPVLVSGESVIPGVRS